MVSSMPSDARPLALERAGELRRENVEREVQLTKWTFGAMLAQAALIVGLVTLLN